MSKKVLFVFSPHQRFPLISRIEIEVILNLLQEGKEVVFLGCNRELPICYMSQYHKESECSKCVFMQKNIRETLLQSKSKESKITFISYDSNLLINEELMDFTNLDEIKSLVWKGYNIGWGIASSIISHYRDHIPDLKRHKVELNKEIKVSKFILDNIHVVYDQYKPDEIYLFNGRFSYQYPVLSFCISNNIDYSIYEFTAKSDQYRVIHNSTPHNIKNASDEILTRWEKELNYNLKYEIGESFFMKTRLGGKNSLDHGYIDYQKKNFLPSSIDLNKEIICVFNSSIDEFAAVKGWEKKIPLFKDEYKALSELCNAFKDDPDKLFVLRVHPNLKFLTNTQNKQIKELANISNLVIIPAESKVDTYALIDCASKVITFGSTIGVEATYWGKPSILLGLSFYQNLDVTYIPQTKEELIILINTKNLPPKNKNGGIKYGFWWMTLGEDFVHTSNEQIMSSLGLPQGLKTRILLLKLKEVNFKYIFSKIFSIKSYKKLLDANSRRTLKKMVNNWVE